MAQPLSGRKVSFQDQASPTITRGPGAVYLKVNLVSFPGMEMTTLFPHIAERHGRTGDPTPRTWAKHVKCRGKFFWHHHHVINQACAAQH